MNLIMNILECLYLIFLLNVTAAQLESDAHGPGVFTEGDHPDPPGLGGGLQPHHHGGEGVGVARPPLGPLGEPAPGPRDPGLYPDLLRPLLTQAPVPSPLHNDPGHPDLCLPQVHHQPLRPRGVGDHLGWTPGPAPGLAIESAHPGLHWGRVAWARRQPLVPNGPGLEAWIDILKHSFNFVKIHKLF